MSQTTERKPLLSDDGLKKIVDRWVAGAVIPDPPYPTSIVRDLYEAERTKNLEVHRESLRLLEANKRLLATHGKRPEGGTSDHIDRLRSLGGTQGKEDALARDAVIRELGRLPADAGPVSPEGRSAPSAEPTAETALLGPPDAPAHEASAVRLNREVSVGLVVARMKVLREGGPRLPEYDTGYKYGAYWGLDEGYRIGLRDAFDLPTPASHQRTEHIRTIEHIASLIENHVPYKDESGKIEFYLQDFARLKNAVDEARAQAALGGRSTAEGRSPSSGPSEASAEDTDPHFVRGTPTNQDQE